ncbi:hypothetical protein ACYB9N_27220, partial [Klebsiella pneumoniae]
GEAAKRDVGTGNNQLPDMSAFGMSRNGQTAWDILPNGMIRQAGTVTLTPVGNFNAQVLGGVTYYTHYYRVNFPRQFPNAQIATLATLASSEFSNRQQWPENHCQRIAILILALTYQERDSLWRIRHPISAKHRHCILKQ